MSRRDQKNCEEGQEHEDDYDIYLFWPSLSNRDVSSTDSPSSPLYGPVSIHSESINYDSRSSSPLTFAPMLDYRPPPSMEEPLDFAAAPPDECEAGKQIPEESATTKYSAMFRLGLFFSQMTHRFVDGVKITLKKPKSRA